jgi:hypothetical protein
MKTEVTVAVDVEYEQVQWRFVTSTDYYVRVNGHSVGIVGKTDNGMWAVGGNGLRMYRARDDAMRALVLAWSWSNTLLVQAE